MLVLGEQRLVYLANPKTATQAIRAMLGPHAGATPVEVADRHINVNTYLKKWAARLTGTLGGTVETFAVVRDPVARLGSWFRYRQRDQMEGRENSTKGLSFEAFIEARLMGDPPPFARIGRQDRFVGYDGARILVDHVFDYARLPLLVRFVSDRVGDTLSLGQRNVSPQVEAKLDLSPALLARLKAAHAEEFALYARVAEKGVLRRER